MTAIVLLGMHRSGTSCLAGMLAAARVASSGPAIRNWDNARGHHEMLDLVRLDEAVLAHSGGHYLTPPREVRWTEAQAAERDRLLSTPIDGLPPLLKDPRMLLVLPFWRASSIPCRTIGIVRHPLAVARSLAMWREMPLADGVALWLAHARGLAGVTPVIDFDQPKELVVEAVAAWAGCDASVLVGAYDERIVHHDDAGAPAVPRLDEAIALYRQLGGQGGQARHFPRAELERFEHLLRAGSTVEAVECVRAAIAVSNDPAAVLVPAVTALVRSHAYAQARDLIEHVSNDRAAVERAVEARSIPVAANAIGDLLGLANLLRGKVLLAMGDPAAAAAHLEAACSVPAPLYQARHLLPHALRGAGRPGEARAALERIAAATLYPHGPLSTLAEWSFLDGERDAALADMARAIEAAPLHRRGRLRTRRAEWLRDAGDLAGARAELERAIEEDPGYPRSREVLAALTT